MKKSLWIFIFTCAGVLAGPSLFAQYNPLTETPLDIIKYMPAQEKAKPKGQNPAQAKPALDHLEEIDEGVLLDPERGLIFPGDEPDPDTAGPAEAGENAVDTQADSALKGSYIDRQIEKVFGRFTGYIKSFFIKCKGLLFYIWEYLKSILAIFASMPIVQDPPSLGVSVLLFLASYALACYPLKKIAHTISNDEWMAWVPVLQLILLLRITERSNWRLLVFLIPVVNLVFLARIFSEICEMLQQPAYYGILILVPGVNIALLWYLAYIEFE